MEHVVDGRAIIDDLEDLGLHHDHRVQEATAIGGATQAIS
eukprot:CAMPEP_0185906690 /NCGR_PEP_ID=MMETSP0196C-20130402/5809_1 /TAXON_ID=2932 /ORGANISM="Alexandrium fundyense, Strain CCMP1719" /LENGTH=39 /DNA_ID= /DNA_START= /DNA_END= /DNA_ORIENTATION=